MINLPTHHLTPEQLHARENFCLEKTWQALPPDCRSNTSNTKGGAGTRLRGYLVATISDDLLIDFAKSELGAQRCGDKYLQALRVVLGNQADADRKRYPLELNIRNSCDVPERVMRNVIDQMKSAGITKGRLVILGEGRSQVVQCYDPDDKEVFSLNWLGTKEEQIEALYRLAEGYPKPGNDEVFPCPYPQSLTPADIPY